MKLTRKQRITLAMFAWWHEWDEGDWGGLTAVRHHYQRGATANLPVLDYRTTNSLVRRGLLEQNRVGDEMEFRITEAGLDALEEVK